MKARRIIAFTVIIFIVVTIAYISLMYIPILSVLKDVFVQSLLGAAYGTFAGAFLIYILQVNLEQVRYFQIILDNGQKIMADNTAWIKENGVWKNVEFRKALGMARWSRDPRNHLDLHSEKFDDCKSVDWRGVAYRIDDDYCVASKALHEYTGWIKSILEAGKFDLLSKKHILLMWRMIADAMYPPGPFTTEASGMRRWLEFFLLGDYIEKKEDIGRIDKSTYNDYLKFRNIVEKYGPVINHYEQRHAKS